MQFMTQSRRATRFHLSATLTLLRRAALPVALPAAVLLGVSLTGCASSNTTSLINLPNGQTGFAVNCSGADAASSWASC